MMGLLMDLFEIWRFLFVGVKVLGCFGGGGIFVGQTDGFCFFLLTKRSA